MISHRHWVVVAALALTTGCAATRSATGGPTMMGGMTMGGMAQGGMAHDTAAMPSLTSMMQRAETVVQRAERMMSDASAATPHAMAMEHAAGGPSQTMAGHVHAMAKGLRGLLQQMEGMHRPGAQMDRETESAMMELHQRSNAMLGELEKTMQALDRLQKLSTKGR